MIALNILDIKDTMAHLLLQDSFDNYYLEEVQVTTFATMKIQGRRNQEWYDSKESEEAASRLVLWQEVKPFVFQYIKGKKTPTSFLISLKLRKEDAHNIIDDMGVLQLINENKIDFLLHFRFDRGKLSVVTGSSQNEFIIDRMPEITWDTAVKKYIRQLKISYEI